MSGPVLRGHGGLIDVIDCGTYDGITITVRPDLGGQSVLAPPLTSCGNQTIEPWMIPMCHMLGDFQFNGYTIFGNNIGASCIVFQFSKPIRRVRMKQFYGTITGTRMEAVVSAADIGPGGIPTATVGVEEWAPREEGKKVITSEEPFSFLVVRTNGQEDTTSYLSYGATFGDFFFYETIPLAAQVQPPSPDLALPPGAGRMLSYWWPVHYNGLGSVPMNIVYRQWGNVSHDTFPMVETAIGGTTTPLLYHGRLAMRIAAPTGNYRFYQPPVSQNLPFSIHAPLLQTGRADIGTQDEWRCWRVALLMAADALAAPAPNGMGITIGAGANTLIVGGAQAGIMFGITDDGDVAVRVRKVDGGPLTFDELVPTDNANLTHWHRFEVRLIGATIGGDAYLAFYFDGVLVLTLPWGAGTVLPDPVNSINGLGFRPSVGNWNGGAQTTNMYIAIGGGLEVHAAATEGALL